MKENSRIRFNPVTGEIEVEGSERFVKTYFEKLQELCESEPMRKRGAAQLLKKVPAAKPVKEKKAGVRTRGGRETQVDKVVSLVIGSPGGITTTALKEKTGLNERQIWSIVYRAQKLGKIKKTKRGMYAAA